MAPEMIEWGSREGMRSYDIVFPIYALPFSISDPGLCRCVSVLSAAPGCLFHFR
jgi:hypothetical protein